LETLLSSENIDQKSFKKRMNLQQFRDHKYAAWDPSELKVSRKACAKLNNIHHIMKLSRKLFHNEKVNAESHASDFKVLIKSGFDMIPIRPYSCPWYIRVSRNGQLLGKSAKVSQSRAPFFNSCVFAHGSAVGAGLHFELVHCVGTRETRLASGDFLDDFVNFGTYGKIVVQICRYDGDHFFVEKIDNLCVALEVEIMELIAGNICKDFQQRFKKISKNYKTTATDKVATTMTSLMSKMKKSKSTQSVDNSEKVESVDVETSLTPIFTFLDANLGELTYSINEDLSLSVVSQVWLRILGYIEGLIVGGLEDEYLGELLQDSYEIKTWDEKRMAFMKIAVEVCCELS